MSIVLFAATEVLPGDAVGVLAGQDATQAERDAIGIALGLDEPAPARYAAWLGGALRGDLGMSLVSGRSVADIVGNRIAVSFAIVLPASVLLVLLASTLGLAAGMRAGGRLDAALTTTSVGIAAVPDFLVGTALLFVFAIAWPVLPAVAVLVGDDSLWRHPELVVLPALALALGGFGATMRLLRASVADVAASPVVEHARLAGVRGSRLLGVVVRVAAVPALHALGIVLAGTLGGAIVVETLFNVPGAGNELQRAIADRDVPLVQGLGLVLTGWTLSILLICDLAAACLAPRAQARTVAT